MENEFTNKDTWRIFKIMAEFVEGFERMHSVGRAVSIFGSARLHANSRYYKLGRGLARRLVEEGYAVITGGGGGIMEAGNRGAAEAGGVSVGLNIDLPLEQEANKHINHLIDFHYFFCRKVMFVKYATAFVILPGGFGTLDELAESLTLIQTRKIKRFPVILMGADYWQGLLDWFRTTMLKAGCIDEDDMALFSVTDDVDEAVRLINESPVRRVVGRNIIDF